jgi:hypothetical protein
MVKVTRSVGFMANSRRRIGSAQHGPAAKHDISYMVASHLQGDIVSGEKGGCGLISGLDRGTYPPAPMDFAAKVLI